MDSRHRTISHVGSPNKTGTPNRVGITIQSPTCTETFLEQYVEKLSSRSKQASYVLSLVRRRSQLLCSTLTAVAVASGQSRVFWLLIAIESLHRKHHLRSRALLCTMPLRTRVCSTCRKKRIKCDGTLAQCLMCKRTGKSCPGPLEGPLIVDMTANAKNGMKRGRKKYSTSMLCAHSIQAHHLDIDPLVSTATTIAFYESFLNHFTSEGESKDIRNQLTWLQRLPDLVTDRSDKALVLALEATATAHGAIMSSNIAMTRQTHDLWHSTSRSPERPAEARLQRRCNDPYGLDKCSLQLLRGHAGDHRWCLPRPYLRSGEAA